MNGLRCALLLTLVSQGCLLYDGRTPSDDAGADGLGSGGGAGWGGSTGIDGAVAGSGGSSAGAGGATTGTGGTATGGAAGSTTGAGGSATGGAAGSGGASGSGGKGGTAGTGGKGASGAAGTGGSTVIDSGVDASTPPDSGVVDAALPDRSGGDACTSPASLDTDGDGTPDCDDGCPRDAKKTVPGVCGCNLPEASGSDGGALGCLRAALVHRYAFNAAGGADGGATDAGTGIPIVDSIGTAHGTARGGANATLTNGTLVLSGDRGAGYTNEGFVSLPTDVLGSLTNATLEVWVTWNGAAGGTGTAWQRIFDFGDQQASGTNQNGHTYLFLTPSSGSNTLRMAWSSNGTSNETVIDQTALPTGMLKHVAVVIDDTNGSASLCVDGACTSSVALTGALRGISAVNNWLGRSNFSVDPELNGVLHEFRIYGAALSPSLVRASFMAGPDAAF